MWIVAILICAVVISSEVPNINYISLGYNILYGNPQTTANKDPGYLQAIFDVSNCSEGHKFNGHEVPNGVTVVGVSTCSLSFDYSSVTGANSYQNTLKKTVSFSGELWNASFGVSRDFRTVYNETKSGEHVYTSTYCKCGVYNAQVNIPNNLPVFTQNFITEVQKMPNYYNKNDNKTVHYFYEFFTHYFGTHYIKEILMGGIFGQITELKSFSYSQYTSSNLEITTSAEYSALLASGAATSLNSEQKETAEDYKKVALKQNVFNIGGNLPSDGDASEWQKSLENTPLPIHLKLESITQLITKTNLPTVHNVTQKQKALEAALDNYCSELNHMNPSFELHCKGYPHDPKTPPSSIYGGMYADPKYEPSEPYNPFADDKYTCSGDFIPMESGWLQGYYEGAQTFVHQYVCMKKDLKEDPMHYFGGIYQISEYIQKFLPAKTSCVANAYMTHNCTCTKGFKSVLIGTQKITHYPPINQYFCYNESYTTASKTVIGGFYQTGQYVVNNEYSKIAKCPGGFEPHKVGYYCCDFVIDFPQHCQYWCEQYICENNVYSV
eukprot:61563_1